MWIGGRVSLTWSIGQSEPSSGRCRGICDKGPTHLVDNVVMPAYTDAVNWRSEVVDELTHECSFYLIVRNLKD
jgi:hypothetical protein